jgi:serine/tyrosine/threonine adenylyltransferase
MASAPFERYGAEEDEARDPASCPLDKEVAEERRLCGMGDSKMLGFQCSCSS